jgi:anti-sigma B factor antagonist
VSPVRRQTGDRVTQLQIDEVAPNRYRISGELDMDSAPRLEEALAPVIATSEHLVLDLGDLTFIDSSGLHTLVKLAARMNGSAPLTLGNVPPGVQRILDIVGLESLPGIEVEHDVDA